MTHMARHDALTDLANRSWFREQLDEALLRMHHHNENTSILVLDLDMFKSVNDSLGHPIGDKVLKMVAERLRPLVKPSDTIGRLGGDEFAILQTNEPAQHHAASALAQRIIDTLAAPYHIDGHEIVIGASIGIVQAPADGDDPSKLLKHADLALYRAKSSGRRAYRFFEAKMDSELRLRRELEIDLRQALLRDEFELHYQPVIDAATRIPDGAEALVRWRHPARGMIPPDRFIALAEETGLIVPLGEWILLSACMQAAVWPEHIRLAVNLSPVQFRNFDLVKVVRSALEASGLPPARLELEITESVLLQKSVGAIDMLHEIKKLGVGIVLDDFGTGYSSLSYLRMFPFDKIKIDRSFITEMAVRDDCAAIVAAITGLARSLEIETTAEGVETAEQFALLRAAGCTHAQGYLLGRPCPARELDFTTARVAAAVSA
jgi:diguanylate cyclase (GGDEF)-like protein